MASWGSCDYEQLRALQGRLEQLQRADLDRFCQQVSRALAARLLALVIPITPLGTYPRGSGKKGGTLRRGWTARTEAEAAGPGQAGARAYANALPVTKQGEVYRVEIINPVHYASYVEFGHRTRGGQGWVSGQYFLTISEEELRRLAPRLIERKLQQCLMEVFRG